MSSTERLDGLFYSAFQPERSRLRAKQVSAAGFGYWALYVGSGLGPFTLAKTNGGSAGPVVSTHNIGRHHRIFVLQVVGVLSKGRHYPNNNY